MLNHSNTVLLRRWIAQLLVLTAALTTSLWSFATEPPFKIEESYGATVGTTQPLPLGAKLEFSASGFKANEVFMLQRCGEPCTTAKMVRTWKKSDFESSSPKLVVLTESGTYYFWILRRLENGESGPVLGERSTFEGMKGTIQFASGTTISVEVQIPSASQ
ncbi:hypothetical protein HZ993_02155 [Rhodoferax sp. AJA081-3]|uniref:hypothetical protein n=1 Tax=Rhodoferax sp. AJA081-3 TaxID=2752316 RepID=UPI001ADF7A58|nr:hypothetical protein [Rhodoferax sp. AJA081-3]QTN28678.1 hypothetical protein HZ993_02155 [Rhodoferax sp. AJA081-3]